MLCGTCLRQGSVRRALTNVEQTLSLGYYRTGSFTIVALYTTWAKCSAVSTGSGGVQKCCNSRAAVFVRKQQLRELEPPQGSDVPKRIRPHAGTPARKAPLSPLQSWMTRRHGALRTTLGARPSG